MANPPKKAAARKPAAKKTTPKKAAAKKPPAKKAAPKKPTNVADLGEVRKSKKAAEFLDKGKVPNKDETKFGPGHNGDQDTDFNELNGFIVELADMKQDITAATAKLRTRLKAILETKKWNKSAVAEIRKVANMTQTARADYLRTFKILFAIMCHEKWDNDLRDMIDQLEDEASPEQQLDPAEFEDVDTDAEQGKAKPTDPEIAEETESFEAAAEDLEKELEEG